MLKFLITAASSNSGKTAVTCGLLSLLKRKGFDPCAFKCGPDYIDPMFHRSVLGIESANLDVFLAGEEGVREAFARGCQGHDAAVCEGVMGFYDGMTSAGSAAKAGQAADPAADPVAGGEVDPFAGTRASAWHVASLLEIPAILVVRPKGAALTLAAVIQGMAGFRRPSRICGVILNDCSEMYYRMYAPAIEAESGIPVLGYVPHMEEAVFESRHLGLMTAEEIKDLGERIDRIGARMEETIDLERLVQVASGEAGAPEHPDAADALEHPDAAGVSNNPPAEGSTNVLPRPTNKVRIAVARDAAFNFIYAASVFALEDAGAELVYFSPLKDHSLPEGIAGLYLPGGYPELYGKELSENESMRTSIREAIKGGLPTIAECGGFLYLGETLADADGESWSMAGALPGHGAGTGKLVRFGYGTISCEQESMLFNPGEEIPVHEFHYWDTTAQGEDLTLTKNSNGKRWRFGYAGETIYAGFPHLYLAGGALAERFTAAARKYADEPKKYADAAKKNAPETADGSGR